MAQHKHESCTGMIPARRPALPWTHELACFCSSKTWKRGRERGWSWSTQARRRRHENCCESVKASRRFVSDYCSQERLSPKTSEQHPPALARLLRSPLPSRPLSPALSLRAPSFRGNPLIPSPPLISAFYSPSLCKHPMVSTPRKCVSNLDGCR